MFNWIGDYASWAWDTGTYGAMALFVVSMVALGVVVLAVLKFVLEMAGFFGQGFRKGMAKSSDEQKP